MRKLLNLLIAALCMFTMHTTSAFGQMPLSTIGDIIIFKPKKPSTRPKLPGIGFQAIYNNGIIEFDIPLGYEYLKVTVIDETDVPVMECTITPENPYMTFNAPAGTYTIECISDSNQMFVGYLNL